MNRSTLCDPNHVHLDPNSFVLKSPGCHPDSFCSLYTGQCLPKLCRSHEYPWHWPSTAAAALCPSGSFCADEEDRCRPLLPAGALCQMNRDDQCAPPLLDSIAAGSTALCLNFTCVHATATLNQPCFIDTVTHRLTDPQDRSMTTLTISRSNCVPNLLFCHPESKTCANTKPLGEQCTEGADWECASGYCDDVTAHCANPPATPYRITGTQFVLAFVTIVVGMLSVCGILIFIHKRQRNMKRREINEYYREQTAYRNAMNAIIAAYATGEGEGAVFDEIDLDHDYHRDLHDDSDSRPLLAARRDSSWKFGPGSGLR